MSSGGVPERANGAVLKTASAVTGARGFESHPRRSSAGRFRQGLPGRSRKSLAARSTKPGFAILLFDAMNPSGSSMSTPPLRL
jgi:hypothetical protein